MTIVRNAVEADLAAIVNIYNAAIPGRLATADLHPITVESRREWFAKHSSDRYPLWVAESGGRVVGWLSLQRFYGRPAYHATCEVSIYIAPDCQGQGIGRYLLTKAIYEGDRLGICTLLGFVFAHNRPSLKLFEKLKFREWGYLPGVAEMDGVERDVVIFGRRV